MRNLSAEDKNLTRHECGLCLNSPVYDVTLLLYVLISLPANGRVLWLMVSSPAFWTSRMEVCAFHLALTEMLFGFLGPPFLTLRRFVDIKVADIMMKLINLMFTARIEFQNCVCIERYVAVLRPALYCRYKPLRYRMSFCCVLWVKDILVGIFQIYFCSDRLESLVVYGTFYLIVFIVNTFCCLSVLRALKQPSPGEGEQKGPNLVKKRAFKIVLLQQVTVCLSYIPQATILFLVNTIERSTLCVLLPLVYAVMVWFGVIHPLLYLQRNGK